MNQDKLLEKILDGMEIRDIVSCQIGEYSTDDPREMIEALALNMSRTIIEDILEDEEMFHSLFGQDDISKEWVRWFIAETFAKVAEYLKEL